MRSSRPRGPGSSPSRTTPGARRRSRRRHRLSTRTLAGRITRVTLGLDTLEPLGPQAVDQLGVDELHALAELLEVGLSLGRNQREVELVEDLEDPQHEGLRGELDRPRLLLQHPLAVVLELGLQALEVVAVLLRLSPRVSELVGRRGGSLRRRGAGRIRRRPPPRVRPHASLVRHLDPGTARFLALAVVLTHAFALISILFGRAFSVLGMSIVSTPLSKDASTFPASAVCGRAIERVNDP